MKNKLKCIHVNSENKLLVGINWHSDMVSEPSLTLLLYEASNAHLGQSTCSLISLNRLCNQNIMQLQSDWTTSIKTEQKKQAGLVDSKQNWTKEHSNYLYKMTTPFWQLVLLKLYIDDTKQWKLTSYVAKMRWQHSTNHLNQNPSKILHAITIAYT